MNNPPNMNIFLLIKKFCRPHGNAKERNIHSEVYQDHILYYTYYFTIYDILDTKPQLDASTNFMWLGVSLASF